MSPRLTLLLLLFLGCQCDGRTDISERLDTFERDMLASQAIIKSDINLLFQKVSTLSASGGDNGRRENDNVVEALQDAVLSLRNRNDLLEEQLTGLTETMNSMKMVDDERYRRSFKRAFMAEKKERKKLQILLNRMRSDTIAGQNESLLFMEERLTCAESDVQALAERILTNEGSLQRVDNRITNNLVNQMNTLQATMNSTDQKTQEKLSAVGTAICDLNPPCSEWSEWTTCSARCESTGTQSRTRMCMDNNYSFCPSDYLQVSEVKPCANLTSCCPDGYDQLDSGLCFKTYWELKRLSEMKRYCESQGDHLVSLTTETIQAEFIKYAVGQFNSSDWFVLIDGRQTGSDWLTYHGSPLPYTNWDSGQPAGVGGCIYIYLKTGKWCSTFCSSGIYTFICERGG